MVSNLVTLMVINIIVLFVKFQRLKSVVWVGVEVGVGVLHTNTNCISILSYFRVLHKKKHIHVLFKQVVFYMILHLKSLQDLLKLLRYVQFIRVFQILIQIRLTINHIYFSSLNSLTFFLSIC